VVLTPGGDVGPRAGARPVRSASSPGARARNTVTVALFVAVAVAGSACGGPRAADPSGAPAPAGNRAAPAATTATAAIPEANARFSFDDPPPAPPLANAGRDFPAIYRSLESYWRWMWAHRPDPSIASRIYVPGSTARSALDLTLLPFAQRGARVYWTGTRVRSVSVFEDGATEVTLRVRWNTGTYHVVTRELGEELAVPGRWTDEHVVLRADRRGRWRIAARYATPFTPPRVQQPGEVWPDVGFDGSVPPPPVAGRGAPPEAAVRTLLDVVRWMFAHHPDASATPEVFDDDEPGFRPMQDRLGRYAARGRRFFAPFDVIAVKILDDRDDYVTARVEVRAGAGQVVAADGSVTGRSEPWAGAVTAVVHRDAGGYWRFADLFAADDQPDPDNPLRIPSP
jgi:hypothetical protein